MLGTKAAPRRRLAIIVVLFTVLFPLRYQ
jgi:hypothetical protein